MEETTKASGSARPRRTRLTYIDSVRGIAVALMFVWHSAHSWLAPSMQTGPPWRALRLLGGLAAPIFFVMLGAALQVRLSRRSPSLLGLRAVVARGGELIAFGYLLRLQFWTIDGPGATSATGLIACALLAGGYLAAVTALRRFASSKESGTGHVALATGLLGAGLLLAHHTWEDSAPRLLKVDVLQALGLSMIVGGSLRMGVPAVSSLPGGAVAVVVTAFACYPLARMISSAPPPVLSHYLVRLPRSQRLAGKARFPIFPWLSLAIAGMVITRALDRLEARTRGDSEAIAIAIASLAASVGRWEGWSHIDALMQAWPSTVQPLRMLFRIAAVTAPCAALWWYHRRRGGGGLEWLRLLGRHSLLLYWVHLELVFGRPSNALHERLGFASWAVALAALAVAMYGLASFDPAARLRELRHRDRHAEQTSS